MGIYKLKNERAEKGRKERTPDKLQPIREVFECWNSYLREAYVLGWSMTVDEQLVTFRGRCPFRQYIPSKPGKYGIKFWMVCDSFTGYVWKLQIYKGKEIGENLEVNQGERVVKDVVQEIIKSGRNITCDNCFISLSLAEELLKMDLTLVGTIRKKQTLTPTSIYCYKRSYSQFFTIWISKRRYDLDRFGAYLMEIQF